MTSGIKSKKNLKKKNMNYALYLIFKEDFNTLRQLTAHNQITDIADSFDYVVRQITDSSGIPFVTASAEKQWQIMALRASLPNISLENAEILINKYAPVYS